MANRFGLEKITDETTRQVLVAITDVIDQSVFLGFRGKLLRLELGAGTFAIPHKLGFVPRDTFLTSYTASEGTVAVEFNYDLFTATHFSLTVTLSVPTATATIRAFMGRMLEEGI